MFSTLSAPAPDGLHAVMDRFRADQRADKIDLGVGVFRNERGVSPVMRAVAAAEQQLAARAGSKAYLPLAGDPLFLRSMERLILGEVDGARQAAMIQSTGGTGALRLALDLTKRASPTSRVHLGSPSWPSHEALVKAAGLELVQHNYFHRGSAEVDYCSIDAAACSAARGDIFVLHGPCHNPTGADLSREQRRVILQALAKRGAIPLIDAAYVGLGDGLAQDLAGLAEDLAHSPSALLAVSCSKMFGLYRERTGVLFAFTESAVERERVQGHLENINRVLVSMSPAHGAAIVAHILEDVELAESWRRELAEMQARVAALRSELGELAQRANLLAKVAQGRGIFSLLPIGRQETEVLATTYGIHMPQTGRINITGLKQGDAIRLADALARV